MNSVFIGLFLFRKQRVPCHNGDDNGGGGVGSMGCYFGNKIFMWCVVGVCLATIEHCHMLDNNMNWAGVM